MTRRRSHAAAAALAAGAMLLAGCSTAADATGGSGPPTTVGTLTPPPQSPPTSPLPSPTATKHRAPAMLPGMPPLLDRHDVYAADRPGDLSPVVRGFPARVYVPNSGSNTVTVIDPRT